MAGNAAEAVSLAGRAQDLADKHGERGYLAYAHAALAEASGALPPPARDAAESHWRRAAALAEELEMRPLTARCHLGLGTLHRQLDRAEAAEELGKAATILDELGMPLWLARARAELRRLL
jgi:hypothetical protein